MSLQFTYIRFFAYGRKLRNWGANCSAIDLCCVTTWQQIFEDAHEVTVVGVLPHFNY